MLSLRRTFQLCSSFLCLQLRLLAEHLPHPCTLRIAAGPAPAVSSEHLRHSSAYPADACPAQACAFLRHADVRPVHTLCPAQAYAVLYPANACPLKAYSFLRPAASGARDLVCCCAVMCLPSHLQLAQVALQPSRGGQGPVLREGEVAGAPATCVEGCPCAAHGAGQGQEGSKAHGAGQGQDKGRKAQRHMVQDKGMKAQRQGPAAAPVQRTVQGQEGSKAAPPD